MEACFSSNLSLKALILHEQAKGVLTNASA